MAHVKMGLDLLDKIERNPDDNQQTGAAEERGIAKGHIEKLDQDIGNNRHKRQGDRARQGYLG